ncbi:solute carrier family 2, facilitated glucose transporter member 6-like [Planococcus citri]|uniref:solute carrier family 2, facilitated glucose transporter member 6-like n=1 Tax=Planococcus citri TaxID=170843 RepID=UPI0031F7270D
MTKSAGTVNQVLSLMTVAFNELTIGIANGWVAPTLNGLRTPGGELSVTIEESSWIASLDHFGKIFGAIFTAFILDIVGRKILLTASAFVLFAIWVIVMFTRSVPILYVMRIMFGVFVGLNDGTNSNYLAENSSPYIRGVFGAVCITLYYIGLLAEFTIATYCSYSNTALINVIITFLAFLPVIWIKEPVQFLLMKGKIAKAEKNFAWLHGSNMNSEEIKVEFERIKQNAQAENLKKSSFKKTITAPANYKSMFIMITIHALAGSTGYFPVMSYASIAFSASDILTPNEFTVLFGIAQTLVVALTSFVISRFSRRTIILISFSLIAASHAVTTGLYYVNSNVVAIPYFPWLIFASITFYASVYAFVYPVVFVIRGELFPLSVKATGGCLSVIAFSTTSFLTTKMFLYISNAYGIEANFLLFAFLTLLTILFVYIFLPETKNKSLIEIQEMLEKND